MSEEDRFRDRILPGMFAVSTAGHDKNHLYIITGRDETYVYLADGIHRTVSRPKKKKYQHIQYISCFSVDLHHKICSGEAISNEDVAAVIAAYKNA